MASQANPTLRRWILTGAVTAVTVTGALYGAGLKMRQEFNEERQAVQELTIDQKIEQLEKSKSKYLEQSNEMQQKIDQLQQRIKSKSQGPQQQTG